MENSRYTFSKPHAQSVDYQAKAGRTTMWLKGNRSLHDLVALWGFEKV
jgi:hypothetical protein